jgi:large subunit ribosomal protein L30
MSAIKVEQIKSYIGQPKNQRLVLRGLGLRKIGATNTLKDNNCIRGMINKVRHLVKYEIVND